MKSNNFRPTRTVTASPPVFSPRAGEKGFTLVEVLIAMTVLSVGIMALTLMLKQSVSSTDYGRKVTTAENLALQRLEEIKADGYTNIPSLGGAATPEDYGSITGYPEYRREVSSVILQGIDVLHPEGFMARVTVKVSWRSVGSIGLGGAVTLATFISK